MKYFYILIATIAILGRGWGAEPAPALGQGNVRVVFVGDSITGQGARNIGFVTVIDAALRGAYPGSKPVLIPLGGSGQSVGGWRNVETRSRTTESTLDVRDVGVKATLDQPADGVVIMLGMNDVIAPYIDDREARLEQWIGGYAKLVDALKERVQPKFIALCGITLCTEDLTSPKNQLIDKMNQRVRALAEKSGALYLPTSETMKEVLNEGRRISPKFHLSSDYVHPNTTGHLAIAIGMLRGLGETAAAQWLVDQRLSQSFEKAKGTVPAISWEVLSAQPEGKEGQFVFRVRYDWPGASPETQPEVKLVAPEGWSVTPENATGASGEFTLTGRPDRLRNVFILEGSSGEEVRQTSGAIAAPWLLTAKLIQNKWVQGNFDAAEARTPVCDAIEKGLDFTVPMEGTAVSALTWQPIFPNPNYMGGENPSNVDFAAITHAANFEGGYGARWIYSDRDRDVTLDIQNRMFAGSVHLIVWVNGQEVKNSKLVKKEGVDAKLKKGWNALAFKSNHRTWLWQFSIAIAGAEGDTLDDLRYSITPRLSGLSASTKDAQTKATLSTP